MSNTVIQVENVSKQYRLGKVGTGTITRDLHRWWHTVRGKEDPFLKIGEENDRTKKGGSDLVWALKNINFEVKQGEVVGVIGRNGAGKSTLLKILSRTTSPTTGSIKLKGRVASLLEVGTGFHPELSGRENIFLNGAILGMTRAEIRSKFDEIVDFAGVERYIDTPVKRYSSGMYVRLAFAVAAHLEPEILIVDEVLAVGDSEFQKKCLGKMKDVSVNDGRTVIFVSHQMDAISRLCEQLLVMQNGQIGYQGPCQEGINFYLKGPKNNTSFRSWKGANAKPGDSVCRLLEVKVTSNKEISEFVNIDQELRISFEYEVLEDNAMLTHGFNLYNQAGTHILSSHDTVTAKQKIKFRKGIYIASITLPANFLTEGFHYISLAMMSYDPYIVHFHEMEAASFVVVEVQSDETARGIYGGHFPGLIRPLLKWETQNLT